MSVDSAIAQLRGSSAPGPDDVPPALLQLLSSEQKTSLEAAFRHRLLTPHSGSQSAEARWGTLRLVFLPKPGKDVTRLRNWRPISLIPTINKLYEMWLWQGID